MNKKIKKLDVITPTTQYGNLYGVLNNINYKDVEEDNKKDIEDNNEKNQ